MSFVHNISAHIGLTLQLLISFPALRKPPNGGPEYTDKYIDISKNKHLEVCCLALHALQRGCLALSVPHNIYVRPCFFLNPTVILLTSYAFFIFLFVILHVARLVSGLYARHNQA